jgi:hypothetical protein
MFPVPDPLLLRNSQYETKKNCSGKVRALGPLDPGLTHVIGPLLCSHTQEHKPQVQEMAINPFIIEMNEYVQR